MPDLQIESFERIWANTCHACIMSEERQLNRPEKEEEHRKESENDTKAKGIYAEEGVAKVKVPEDVAEKFEAAKQHAHETSKGKGPSAIDEKHKSGFEPLVDRARNLTEVTRAKVQSEGEAETRYPEVGFPARPYVE